MAHDPQWERFAGEAESGVSSTPQGAQPTVGVGGYACDGCGKPHIIIAAIYDDLEADIFLTPDRAREVAAALLQAAARLDTKGVN
jgi:hypothetical protein